MTARRRLFAFSCVIALCVVPAACGGDDSEESSNGGGKEFILKAATAQTGAIAVFDKPAVQGLRLAVKQINEKGGLAGKYPIELEVRDTRSDAAQSAVVTQELIDAGAEFLVVPCDGDLVLASGPIAQEAEVPAMSLCASPPVLTDQVGDYMFGNTFGDNVQGAVLADYAIDQGYKNGYWLNSPETLYTDGVPKYWGTAFEERGGTIVGTDKYSLGQQDFSAIVTRIQGLDPAPDVIMTAAYEPDFPSFVRQLRSAGIETPVIGADGIDTPGVLTLGEAGDGVVHTSAGLTRPGTPLGDFDESFEEEYGERPESAYSAVGADAIRVLDAAVRAAGTTDPKAVRDAMAELRDVQGFTGPGITYAGTNRMPVKQVTLVRIEDGKRELVDEVTVEPDEVPEP